MIFQLDNSSPGFPDPRLAQPDGLIAVGGDLSVLRLLNAYCLGIFPWYRMDGEPYWFSPDPRMILFPNEFHCSKSLRRTLRSGRFELRVDTCFRDVMLHCAAANRPGQDVGTWIDQEFVDAYCALHEEGFAHSFESFLDGRLVGGLYGVSLGDYFCGESMFHDVTDASKAAFARLDEFALLHGFRFVDAQMYTPHLASLGAREVAREDFLQMLEQQDFERTYRSRWCNNSVVLLIGGNQGDRVSLLMQAVARIADCIGIVSMASSLYESAPWGFEAEQDFLNQALVVDTDLDAHEVLRRALAIETELGRVRQPDDTSLGDGRHYASRPIDIDLIFFNSSVVESDDLQLPHPRMHLRRFVLEPLAQIIPDFLHPKFKKNIRQLLDECADEGRVEVLF